MAQITASQVKELRDRTGAGMMDAKKALMAADGDVDTAIKQLRESGALKAEKKSGRATNEGRVGAYVDDETRSAAIVTILCETDFVAKNDKFIDFANKVAQSLVKAGSGDSAEDVSFVDGGNVGDALKEQVATIGENIKLGDVTYMTAPEGFFGVYVHNNGKLGVLTQFKGNADDNTRAVAKQVAMHAAGHDPQPIALKSEDVSAEIIEAEKAIYVKQAESEGKPENIREKIAEGKLKAYFKKVALIEQEFVIDPKKTIKAVIKEAGDIEIENFKIISVS